MPVTSVLSSSFFAAGGVSLPSSGDGGRALPVVSRAAVDVNPVAREVDSARVQLSAFSRVQSAAVTLQSASRQLQSAEATTSAVAARRAAEAFTQAYNDERAALVRAGGGNDARAAEATRTAAAAGEDGRAAVASSQLRRLLGEQAPALREAGIRVERDGSLSVDARALEGAFNANPTAVTQTLGEVGRAAEATVARQLADNGSIGSATRALTERVDRLEVRQSEFENGMAAAQRAVEAASRRYGFGAVGAGAYLGIFGL